MKELKEQDIFGAMDEISVEHITAVIKEIDPEFSSLLPLSTVTNIKAKTFSKAGIVVQRRSWKRGIAILAASLVLVAAAVFTIGPSTALARVVQMLQYIPGLGMVVEVNPEESRYVLTEPVNYSIGSGGIRVEGVAVDSAQAIITLTGNNVPIYKNVSFSDGDDNIYPASGYSIVSGSDGPWQGTYVYSGTIKDVNGLQVVITDAENVVISLDLEKADSYRGYAELGPTDFANGISITAIPAWNGSRMEVNFVSPPVKGMRIESFNPYITNMTLMDSDGNQRPLIDPEDQWQSSSRVFFDISDSNVDSMILTIPSIPIVYPVDQSVKLPIPADGKAEVDKDIELAGFPVKITAIERLNSDKIRVYVDVLYSEDKTEYLDHADLDQSSYTRVSSPDLKHMIYYEIPISPEMKVIKLHFSKAQTMKKGPWLFEINND